MLRWVSTVAAKCHVEHPCRVIDKMLHHLPEPLATYRGYEDVLIHNTDTMAQSVMDNAGVTQTQTLTCIIVIIIADFLSTNEFKQD